MIAPASLAGVHVWFPDPWHKARHNKRRSLIQPAFVATLASRASRPAASFLHCATDWEEYAVQMLEVLSGDAIRWSTSPTATRPPIEETRSYAVRSRSSRRVASVSATACGTWSS